MSEFLHLVDGENKPLSQGLSELLRHLQPAPSTLFVRHLFRQPVQGDAQGRRQVGDDFALDQELRESLGLVNSMRQGAAARLGEQGIDGGRG